MESLSLEKESIIKDIRNLFRLKKELNYIAIKDIKMFFRLGKETKYLEILRIFLTMKKKIIINK